MKRQKGVTFGSLCKNILHPSCFFCIIMIGFEGGIFMNIMICDDDTIFTEQLYLHIQEFFAKNQLVYPEIVIFENGESLLAYPGNKDLVFLDVEMPGKSGIEIGNELSLQNKNILVIMITSHAEFLDDAMRFHVFRYLSKPIDEQRLYRSLQDALQQYHSYNIKVQIETKEENHIINVSDIISVEAQHRKVIIHTTHADYESVQGFQFWIDALPTQSFFQSHRSFIVNLMHVNGYDHFLIHLFHNKLHAYLTRRKYAAFKQAYLFYLESTR